MTFLLSAPLFLTFLTSNFPTLLILLNVIVIKALEFEAFFSCFYLFRYLKVKHLFQNCAKHFVFDPLREMHSRVEERQRKRLTERERENERKRERESRRERKTQRDKDREREREREREKEREG